MDKKEQWITVNGAHIPIKEGQTKEEAVENFIKVNNKFNCEELSGLKNEVKDRVNIHIVSDKDNILPKLKEKDLKKLGLSNNKNVLVKAKIVERNKNRHPDLTDNDTDYIISQALYDPSEIFLGNKEKPYFSFVKPLIIPNKNKESNGIVLLDISENKKHFEVVHWHWIRNKDLEKLKNK